MTLTGRTLALTSCPSFAEDGTEVFLSGLYDVEDFEPVDPAAYVHSPCYLLVRSGSVDAEEWFSVDPEVLLAQADPGAYARMLVADREMEFAFEGFGS